MKTANEIQNERRKELEETHFLIFILRHCVIKGFLRKISMIPNISY